MPSNATKAFVNAVTHFLHDRAEAAHAGCAGRKYAEKKFDMPQIADQFERIIMKFQK